MDNPGDRNVEVFAPFNEAVERTRKILFQPFDLTKWCVIGFAAFLSHFASGSNFSFPKKFYKPGDLHWQMHSSRSAIEMTPHSSGWLIPLFVIGGLFALAFALILMWIGARGRFVFTDCIVRNRGAIAEPWREYRREGNSFFLFSLLVLCMLLAVLGLAAVPIVLPFIANVQAGHGFAFSVGILGVGALLVVIAMAWGIVSQWMVPVMYRQRCSATKAFREVLALAGSQPVAVILYVLFLLVLGVAVFLVACLTICLTCCITAIPYVGTVILLPIYVCLLCYQLFFLRQFGPPYDVWATLQGDELPPRQVSPSTPEEPPPSLSI